MNKPFGEKAGKKIPIKECIFVKSDNFDQKIKVFINPDDTPYLPEKYLSSSSCSQDGYQQNQQISNKDFESMIEEKNIEDHETNEIRIDD